MDLTKSSTPQSQAEAEAESAAEEPVDWFSALPDMTLLQIFGNLLPEHLVAAAQVCTRWRDLCESRRLWSGRRWWGNPRGELQGDRYVFEDNNAAVLRVVAALRRARGVAAYQEVKVCVHDQDEYGDQRGSAFLEASSGDRLRLSMYLSCPSLDYEDDYYDYGDDTEARRKMSPSLVLLLCLRELVKPEVDVLIVDLTTQAKFLTDGEAHALWSCIARKSSVQRLELILRRKNPLLRSLFTWPGGASSLTSLELVVHDEADPSKRVAPSVAVRSLLRALRPQLDSVAILSEDQQPLLAECRPDLTRLGARLAPSLPALLARQRALATLHLRVTQSATQTGLAVLAEALALPSLHHHLTELDVVLWEESVDYCPSPVPRNEFPAAAELAAVAGVAQCRNLVRLALGRLDVLQHGRRGPAALRALLCELPALRRLELRDAPCALALQAMLDQNPGIGPSASLLELAVMSDGDCLGPPTRRLNNNVGSWPGWPATLRRLIERSAGSLHVRLFDEYACLWYCLGDGVENRLREGDIMLLPHHKDAACEGCPLKGLKRCKGVNISDFSTFLRGAE